jgi:hypothetical protein
MEYYKEKFLVRTRKQSQLYQLTELANKDLMDELIKDIVKPNDIYVSGIIMYVVDETVITSDINKNLYLFINSNHITSSLLNLGKTFYNYFIDYITDQNRKCLAYNKTGRYIFEIDGFNLFKSDIMQYDLKERFVIEKVKKWCTTNAYPFEYNDNSSNFDAYDFAYLSIMFYIIFKLNEHINFLNNNDIKWILDDDLSNYLIFFYDFFFTNNANENSIDNEVFLRNINSDIMLSYINIALNYLNSKYKLSSTQTIALKTQNENYGFFKIHNSVLSVCYDNMLCNTFTNGSNIKICGECSTFYTGHGNSKLCPGCRKYRDNHKKKARINSY